MDQPTQVQQICSLISFGNFTNDELNQIVEALKYRRAQLARTKARSFTKDDKVRFTSRGQTYFGIIERVKVKNAVVRVGNWQTYNVPVNMLEAA